MPLFGPPVVLCPYCMTELKGLRPDRSQECTNGDCRQKVPKRYVEDYEKHKPVFIQLFGWSQAGKTVYLAALTLLLTRMSLLWRTNGYSYAALTQASQQKEHEINEALLRRGELPPLTQMGAQEIYVILLHNMERWGGRTLVIRDCAGEYFTMMEPPPEYIKQLPFLLSAPTSLMFIDRLDTQKGTPNMLMNNYINILSEHVKDFRKRRRRLVVTITKADQPQLRLPPHLRHYVEEDPIWSELNRTGAFNPLGPLEMAQYLEKMSWVSDAIRDWIGQTADGAAMIALAQSNNIDLRFSLISSIGQDIPPVPGAQIVGGLQPRRVLDPFFWALEPQSRPA